MKLHASIFLFIFSLNINASIITLESLESSSTALEVDLQGLEWLSLDDPILGTMLQNHSYREITEFGSIWEVDDWRVATHKEMKTLVDSLLTYGTNEDVVQFVAEQWGSNFYHSYTSLIENGTCVMAYTYSGPTIDAGCSQGYIYQPDLVVDHSSRFHTGASIINPYDGSSLDFWNFDSGYTRTFNYLDLNGNIFNSQILSRSSSESHGSLGYSFDDKEFSNGPFFLVRNTVDLPEPSTLAIFALGILGLASRRFKKQS